jgi:hypothetical protein
MVERRSVDGHGELAKRQHPGRSASVLRPRGPLSSRVDAVDDAVHATGVELGWTSLGPRCLLRRAGELDAAAATWGD